MLNPYDKVIQVGSIYNNTTMIKTKTKWGDFFKLVIQPTTNKNYYEFTETLYDENNDIILMTNTNEGHGNDIFFSSSEYPKGRWMIPLIDDQYVRSYYYLGSMILYYDKLTQEYNNFIPADHNALPVTLKSSVEKYLADSEYHMNSIDHEKFKQLLNE